MLITQTPRPVPSANLAWQLTLIRSVWYPELTQALVVDATKRLIELGIPANNIRSIDAPGSFELPLLAKKALEQGVDGVILFGVIVQGDTHHARLVAEGSAQGAMQVQLELGKPIIYEVLYVDALADAKVRCIGTGAKGAIAAETLLSSLAAQAQLRGQTLNNRSVHR